MTTNVPDPFIDHAIAQVRAIAEEKIAKLEALRGIENTLLIATLYDVLGDAGADWLVSKNMDGHGRRPIDYVLAGEQQDVIDFLNRTQGGTYW